MLDGHLYLLGKLATGPKKITKNLFCGHEALNMKTLGEELLQNH